MSEYSAAQREAIVWLALGSGMALLLHLNHLPAWCILSYMVLTGAYLWR